MVASMRALWEMAIAKSQETGVAPAALISGYTRLVREHAGEQITPDMIASIGRDLVTEFGVSAIASATTLHQRDEAIASLAQRMGVDVDAVRQVYDPPSSRRPRARSPRRSCRWPKASIVRSWCT